MNLLQYHIIAFFLGYLLDLIIGDPYSFPHPIRWIGSLISRLDHAFMDDPPKGSAPRFCMGLLTTGIVVSLTLVLTGAVMFTCYWIHPLIGCCMETILTCYCLAAKSLRTESMKVYEKLEHGTLEEARCAVSMIVGRDTKTLTSEGVARATVETIAENTSDGIIAPLFYIALGGPVAGMTYKAINTLDSMIGYKNDRYRNFGTCAARADDVANFLPARLSALFMIAACVFGGKDFSAKNAARIFRRDRYNHKSPNSAQTESVMAGALGLQLAGPASYFGKKVDKPTIGDEERGIHRKDIIRACRLMYLTEFLVVLVILLVFLGVCVEA